MRIQVYTAPAGAPADPPQLAGWFDPAEAKQWADQEWRYGRGTGWPGGGETLFRTAAGGWVRGYWTRWQDKRVQWYEFISEEAARDWLDADVRRHRPLITGPAVMPAERSTGI